ncbi:MAG: hypothetical protein JO102_02580, partial [Elusimicrobia bacterium]|nr:hypothetical protein [Elusimicrobiota bacterium]
ESFWNNIRDVWRKPILVSEFGCPAHNAYQDDADAEKTQATYLVNNWNDIAAHAAGSKSGNAIGGVIFEWVDEWWKAGAQYEAAMHDKTPQTKGPFYGGWMYEEWLGVTSQGNGEQSPFLRRLRASYTAFKNGPWKEPMSFGTSMENASAAKERRHED